ncbi:Disks large-associated protein 4 [Gryllus bimaculatus]|nr:Disks large-associated protein 4 [Gryllus bimaculatus]
MLLAKRKRQMSTGFSMEEWGGFKRRRVLHAREPAAGAAAATRQRYFRPAADVDVEALATRHHISARSSLAEQPESLSFQVKESPASSILVFKFIFQEDVTIMTRMKKFCAYRHFYRILEIRNGASLPGDGGRPRRRKPPSPVAGGRQCEPSRSTERSEAVVGSCWQRTGRECWAAWVDAGIAGGPRSTAGSGGLYTETAEEHAYPFSGTNKHTSDKPKGHGHEQHKIGEQDELASACTLCSVSALSTPSSPTAPPIPGVGGGGAVAGTGSVAESTSKVANALSQSPEYVRKTARLFEGSEKQQELEESDFLNIPAAKKPSYLGLACSLSGYSGLTSYDSKLREGFRTRDKSPAPPPPRPLTTSSMSKTSPPTVNGIGSGSTTNGMPTVSPRSTRGTTDMLNGRIFEDRNQQPSSSKELGASTLRESSRQFMSTMLSDEVDYAHCTRMLNVTHSLGPSPTTPKDTLNSSNSSHYALKRSPGTVRVVEFTSQSKSYVSAIVSSTSSRTSIQTESTEFHQYSSEIVGVNGADAQQDTPKPSRSPHTSRLDTESAVPAGYCTPKSFVQQRIERLYGPGALAQGFFSRTRQQSLTEEESSPQGADTSGTSSAGSPALPVLRHLRPEFRAQLPLTPASTIRSPRRIQRELPSSLESPNTLPILQQQTSVESISDSQPAAPEVPVLVGDSLPVASALSSGEALMSPLLCKEVGSSIKHDQPTNISRGDATQGETFPVQPPAHDKAELVTKEEEKNGHYFLQVLRSEIQRLSKLVESAETELENNNSLPEEAQGKLRAASGQARLLMKQKLQQFEGLCHKNINQSPDEVFPTTSQDLAGFWDMVKLQVDHVDRLFVEIDHLKSCGWVEAANENPGGSVGISTTSAGARRRTAGRRSTQSSVGGSRSKSGAEDPKKGEGARKKEELAQARKRMMEEKRRMLKQQQQQAKEQENIEIFVPHENGK